MKKGILKACALSLIITIFSCSKEPSACFNADKTNVEVGELISLSNCSKESEEFTWNFGDGGSSNSKNSSHTYTTAGTYNVELTAINGKNKSTTSKTIYVEANDPCESVSCVNGNCVNGACNCEEGYQGADCSLEKTPSKMIIKSVIVTKFPATDGNGAGWDLTSGADVFFKLYKGTTEIYDASASLGYFENADVTKNLVFTLNPNSEFASPLEEYTIQLYDYDSSDADDWMGGVKFTPFVKGIGFPTTRTLAPIGGNTAFEIEVEYIW